MSREKIVNSWKNPMSSERQNHPSGNVLEELQKEEMEVLAAGAEVMGWSKDLGNNGRFCTLTKECIKIC